MKNQNISYKIYEFLNLIPKNKVISYKKLWQIFWLHPRKVAQILSQNKETEKYPCYKVIYSNWQIWWYNKGIQEKIKKLENDWFVIQKDKNNFKIIWNKNTKDKNFFRQPKLYNFFVAFPIEWKEKEKFKNLSTNLKQLNNWSFTIQKSETPHITLRFFWELFLKDFQNIIYKTIKSIKKLQTPLLNQIISFNQLDNFHQQVWFYKPKSENIEKNFKTFYIQYHKLIWLPKEKRPYRPHLTIIRVKDSEKFEQIKGKFFEITKNYKFALKINKLTFYAAVDWNFQIPLIEISLTPGSLSF